jgi:hypothetical protein
VIFVRGRGGSQTLPLLVFQVAAALVVVVEELHLADGIRGGEPLRDTPVEKRFEHALAHCVLTANVGLPHASTREAIGLAIHLVVHIDRVRGRRIVREVVALSGDDHSLDRFRVETLPTHGSSTGEGVPR